METIKTEQQQSVGKRFAAIFWNDDISAAHFYKDVGGIPYALAKYCGWQTSLVYSDINGRLQDEKYEKYVQLRTIHYAKTCQRMKLKWLKYFRVMQFVWRHAADYDVLNFYHVDKLIMFLCWLAKKRNPQVLTYVKMDMAADGFRTMMKQEQRGNFSLANLFMPAVDLFTVETKKFADVLREKISRIRRIEYLPNGFFEELMCIPEKEQLLAKENLLLTVGFLGTWQKNTELLLQALTQLPAEKLIGWKVILVGHAEPAFLTWLYKVQEEYPVLKECLVLTGVIRDKAKLAELYTKARAFVLPSREEACALVIPEAMSFGDYLIVTDCCDAFHEYIDMTEEHGFGKIVPNEDAAALQEAIEEVLDGRVDAVKRGELAGKYARGHLDWKVVAEDLNCLLRMKPLKD